MRKRVPVFVSHCFDITLKGFPNQLENKYLELVSQEQDPYKKEILRQHAEHYGRMKR